MLLACKMMGFSVENYTSPQHPLQGLIFQAMMEVSGLEAADLKFGIDGCGLPTYRISLAAAAGIYAILAEPRASDLEATSIAALLRVGESMSREPEMVAGVGRFATALTQATGGRLIAKEGAEGAFGVAVRGPVSLGLALKIADGSERIRDSVVVDILRQLGCLSATEVGELESFVRVELTSHLGVPVGELLPDVELIGVE
jgi:L-asparaginase II